MRIRDLNWMQVEAYLESDDRIVLPVGSTEQHAYLSLETDNILAERAAVEAAEPLGVPVLPAVPYGVTGFTAYPGSPTLSESGKDVRTSSRPRSIPITTMPRDPESFPWTRLPGV